MCQVFQPRRQHTPPACLPLAQVNSHKSNIDNEGWILCGRSPIDLFVSDTATATTATVTEAKLQPTTAAPEVSPGREGLATGMWDTSLGSLTTAMSSLLPMATQGLAQALATATSDRQNLCPMVAGIRTEGSTLLPLQLQHRRSRPTWPPASLSPTIFPLLLSGEVA